MKSNVSNETSKTKEEQCNDSLKFPWKKEVN